jgi:hypothetical protein
MYIFILTVLAAIIWFLKEYHNARIMAYWEYSPDDRIVHQLISVIAHITILFYVIFLLQDVSQIFNYVAKF